MESFRLTEIDLPKEEEDLPSMDKYRFCRDLLKLWWTSKFNSSHKFPTRAELDPTTLPPALLPHLVIIDVLPNDYQWRLFGGAHREEFGGDLTGVKLSDLDTVNPVASRLKDLFDKCCRKEGALFYKLEYENKAGVSKTAFGIVMPLGNKENKITQLITASDWIK